MSYQIIKYLAFLIQEHVLQDGLFMSILAHHSLDDFVEIAAENRFEINILAARGRLANYSFRVQKAKKLIQKDIRDFAGFRSLSWLIWLLFELGLLYGG